MGFDEIVDRRGTNSAKWDAMAAATGVDAPDAIAMWVADMDFPAPEFLQDALRGLIAQANYGYFAGDARMREAVAWWMESRHGWKADPDWMLSTYGLGHAIALILETYTDPGDAVVIFTPVYHEFTYKIRNCGRIVRESPLAIRDGVYHMDLEALARGLDGRERIMLISSPHNPAGRIWTPEELRGLADFCERHDLLMVSDEIHHDLVLPGRTFTPYAVAAPEAAHRTIVLSAASKTFNTAGARLGTATIADASLRRRFRTALHSHQTQPNLLGVELTRAAYSPAGAAWVDELREVIDANQRLFNGAMERIPGLVPMPMQSTYLAWVDFANTGMEMEEVLRRVKGDARIAPSVGREFGTGGETFLRFNLGAPRARVQEAAERLAEAFSDLQ